ncbi:hypothetical protein XFLAVUS301_43030 [Xanthobacter flavus]|uniref:Uncharacterized protein n=1 Tax=Xanthobacter flavus TaxID=281 RepID=A0A9W6FLA6_XANFL|nr:hypothetical protein XFLAVUS301_43030 [Xanthobacter flavus]
MKPRGAGSVACIASVAFGCAAFGIDILPPDDPTAPAVRRAGSPPLAGIRAVRKVGRPPGWHVTARGRIKPSLQEDCAVEYARK